MHEGIERIIYFTHTCLKTEWNHMTGLYTADRDKKKKREWLCLGLQTNRLPSTHSLCNQFYQPQLFTGIGWSIHYSGNVSGQMIALIMYFCRAHWGSTRLPGATEAPYVWESSLRFTIINGQNQQGENGWINEDEAARYFKTLTLNCVKDLTDGELLK